MKQLIVITLIIWALCAATAKASPTLNVYYVRGPDSIEPYHLSYINKQIKDQFKYDLKTKIKIKIKGVDGPKLAYTYGSTYEHFNYWYARLMKKSKRRHWALVLIPPMYKDGKRWMVGLGHTACFRARKRVTLALAVAESINSDGHDRLVQSAYGALHELGHTLGLYHSIDSTSVMHSGVLYYAANGLNFTGSEVAKARDCLRGVYDN